MDGSKSRPAKRSERETVVTLRLPRELHDRLKEAGSERSLTAQIRDRLDASLAVEEAWDSPIAGQLLRTIGYVLAGARILYPGDPDAYSVIELAIRMLLDVFRPEAVQDIVYETYIPATVQMMGKVERLLGFALGRLWGRWPCKGRQTSRPENRARGQAMRCSGHIRERSPRSFESPPFVGIDPRLRRGAT